MFVFIRISLFIYFFYSINVFIDRNGENFVANHVIVTSSIGFLQANHKKIFHPPLPLHLDKVLFISCLSISNLFDIRYFTGL